jgi:hypothetical protein
MYTRTVTFAATVVRLVLSNSAFGISGVKLCCSRGRRHQNLQRVHLLSRVLLLLKREGMGDSADVASAAAAPSCQAKTATVVAAAAVVSLLQ